MNAPPNLQNFKISDLRSQIEATANHMISRRSPENGAYKTERTALLFTGSLHIAVPHALLFSTEISANEKTVWQIMRAMINGSGNGVDAPYRAEIAASVPCTEATVTKSRQMLRLTRWLTLGQHVRDKNGRVMGDIYLMHEEQWPLWETMQVDIEYAMFVEDIANSESNRYPKQAKEYAKTVLNQIASLSEPKEQSLFSLIQTRMESRKSSPPHNIKNFDPVKEPKKQVDTAMKGENGSHIKNFDLEQNHHVKNFDAVTLPPEKNLPLCSSGCSSSLNTNYITRAKGSSELDDYQHLFTQSFPELKNSRYLSEISNSFYGAQQPAVLAIVRQMLQNVDERKRLDLIYQLIGKVWSAQARLSDSIRNLPPFVLELVRRAEAGTFSLDTYGVMVKAAHEDDDPSQLIELRKNWKEL